MEASSLKTSAVVAVECVLMTLLFETDYRTLAALGGVDINAGVLVNKAFICGQYRFLSAVLYEVEVAVLIVLDNVRLDQINVRRLGAARVAVYAAADSRLVIRNGHITEPVICESQSAEVDTAALVACGVAGNSQRVCVERAEFSYIDGAAVAVCLVIEKLGVDDILANIMSYIDSAAVFVRLVAGKGVAAEFISCDHIQRAAVARRVVVLKGAITD